MHILAGSSHIRLYIPESAFRMPQFITQVKIIPSEGKDPILRNAFTFIANAETTTDVSIFILISSFTVNGPIHMFKNILKKN